MLKWAVIFLVIALVAALLGFTGIATAAAGIAKFLFFLFLALCVIFFILGAVAAKKITKLRPSAIRGSRANLNPASSGAGGKSFASARN